MMYALWCARCRPASTFASSDAQQRKFPNQVYRKHRCHSGWHAILPVCVSRKQPKFALPVHLRAGLPISAPFVWSVMYALDWSSGIGTRERKMLM